MSDSSIRVTANLFHHNRADFKPHAPPGRPMNVPYALLLWGYYGGELRAATVDGERHVFNRIQRQELLDVDLTPGERGAGTAVRVARADQLFDDSFPLRPEQLALADIDVALAIATAANYTETVTELTALRRDIVDG